MRHLPHLLIPLVTYYGIGKLGLMLSIPPGFASAVWPASGLALACMILLKQPLATVGLGLAAFGLNYQIAHQGFDGFSLQNSIIPLAIATGTMLQAHMGRYLFQRYIRNPKLLNNSQDIYRFILIVAPFSCLISSSIAVSTLHLSGVLNTNIVAFTWATWWSGDTIGILLFTPLVLTLFANDEVPSEQKVQITGPTLLLFSVVVILFANSKDAHKQQYQQRINDSATHYQIQAQLQLNLIAQTLQSFNALYHSTPQLNQQRFAQYATQVIGNPAIESVSWVSFIKHDLRQQTEQSLQQQGLTNYQFKEIANEAFIKAPKRSSYYPILYIYPQLTQQAMAGLNIGLVENQSASLKKAQQNHQLAAADLSPIEAIEQAKHKMVLYLPITSAEAGYSRPTNFIRAVINIEQLFEPIIKQASQNNYGLTLTDISNPDKSKVLIHSDDSASQSFNPAQQRFEFGQHHYQLKVYANQQFQIHAKDWMSWSILTFGLLTTALMQVFIVIITSVTQTIRDEVSKKTQDLVNAKQTAEAANQAKSRFLANINHEIRTPLNAIINLIKMCLKSEPNPKQQDYLHKAQLASQTLMSLINQTLDYSKIDAGKIDIEDSDFDLVDILLKINAVFSPQAKEKGIEFNITLPENLPKQLMGDPLRIEQILLNLCSNAFKFTEQGSIDIIISIIEKDKNQVQIGIDIFDTGIGISTSQQTHLFDSFQQADSSTTRKYGGTGLGLTISKELIELMGGSISLQSALGQGSQFSIKMPFYYNPNRGDHYREYVMPLFANKQLENNEQAQQAPQASEPLNGKTILLVEDVKMNQFIANDILEDFGAEVIIADNGKIALEKLAQHPTIDLILMDIEMPIMDGYETTENIRSQKRYKDIPIIAMTAFVMTDDITRCLATGMNDHVPKPIDSEKLLEVIQAFI